MCGRSTKSFIDEGRWQTVLDRINPGDYVIIQFGHNDEKPDTDLHTVPGGSFDDNLRKFVREARANGANPILMSSIVRRNFPPTTDTPHNYIYEKEGDTLVDTHGDYIEAVRRVAVQEKVHYIDMNKLTHDLVAEKGPEKSKELYMWISAGKFSAYPEGRIDNMHLNPYGAEVVARIAAEQLCKVLPELRSFFKCIKDNR